MYGKGQILLGAQRLGGGDSQLSRHWVAVVVECAFIEIFCHDYSYRRSPVPFSDADVIIQQPGKKISVAIACQARE